MTFKNSRRLREFSNECASEKVRESGTGIGREIGGRERENMHTEGGGEGERETEGKEVKQERDER